MCFAVCCVSLGCVAEEFPADDEPVASESLEMKKFNPTQICLNGCEAAYKDKYEWCWDNIENGVDFYECATDAAEDLDECQEWCFIYF